jgi:phage repressor protein C with HTH and peptisase S24 domain
MRLSDISGMAGDELRQRIEQRLSELGINAFEAARRGDLERTYIDDILRGRKKSVRNDKMAAVALALDTSQEWLFQTNAGAPAAAGRQRSSDIRPQAPIPSSELVGVTDFPVYAAAQGGNGHLIISFDAIDYVKRPAPLARVKGGYGLLIDGESMSPAFRPGDTALVHPHLPPERGTDVILYHTPPDGEAEAIIKHLIGFSDREWTLEQYRPPVEFKEFRKEWPVCHRVVGKYSRR